MCGEMTSAKSTPRSESKNPTITVLEKHESRAEAKLIATANGGKLPSVKEFIFAIKGKINNRQMDDEWFWTSDEGLMISKESKINYNEGTVVEVTAEEWNALPSEQKAYASSGTGPIAVFFHRNTREDNSSTLMIDSNRGALVAKVAYILNPQQA